MFYREAGQFKTNYVDDAAIFPIRQDRIGIAIIMAIAFVVVPLFATPYLFSAILIPFLILALAAIGLNILTGYAGQLSLGHAAFMAIGAFASYNFMLRIPGMPILLAFIGGGLMAAGVGILFGLPSLRIRGFYWRWRRWPRSSSSSGAWPRSAGSPTTARPASSPRSRSSSSATPSIRRRRSTCWCW